MRMQKLILSRLSAKLVPKVLSRQTFVTAGKEFYISCMPFCQSTATEIKQVSWFTDQMLDKNNVNIDKN